jgi:hypothetical protein
MAVVDLFSLCGLLKPFMSDKTKTAESNEESANTNNKHDLEPSLSTPKAEPHNGEEQVSEKK